MFSFEEVGEILDEIAEELPQAFFNDLNGGILLLPDTRRCDDDSLPDVYTMGQYVRDGMGRYIIIYYGSFAVLYGHSTQHKFREALRETLLHEFTHHVESLAGAHDLEIKDDLEMARLRAPRKYRVRSDTGGIKG